MNPALFDGEPLNDSCGCHLCGAPVALFSESDTNPDLAQVPLCVECAEDTDGVAHTGARVKRLKRKHGFQIIEETL